MLVVAVRVLIYDRTHRLLQGEVTIEKSSFPAQA